MSLRSVGFLGLGIMGSRMARTLARKGFAVTVWNRTRAKAVELERDGIKVADSPEALAGKVEAVCTCVATPAALEEVTFGPKGLLHGARRGQLVVDFSTVSVSAVERISRAYSEVGVDFLDAPVTGSKLGAEKGSLVLIVGGTEPALERAKPLFAAVGEKYIHCGPVGSGTQVKLAGNALIAAMLQALSEGLLLTSKAGVDPRTLLEVVQASGFRSPYFEFKGQAILNRDFGTHFSVELMHKDLGLFLENAAVNRVPTPTAASLRETYNVARAAGKGDLDIAAVITAFEQLCGHRVS